MVRQIRDGAKYHKKAWFKTMNYVYYDIYPSLLFFWTHGFEKLTMALPFSIGPQKELINRSSKNILVLGSSESLKCLILKQDIRFSRTSKLPMVKLVNLQ